MIAAYHWVVRNCGPLRSVGNLCHAHREWIDMESIDLPLSSDGRKVDMIMTRRVMNRV
jgi:hypothetical protein